MAAVTAAVTAAGVVDVVCSVATTGLTPRSPRRRGGADQPQHHRRRHRRHRWRQRWCWGWSAPPPAQRRRSAGAEATATVPPSRQSGPPQPPPQAVATKARLTTAAPSTAVRPAPSAAYAVDLGRVDAATPAETTAATDAAITANVAATLAGWRQRQFWLPGRVSLLHRAGRPTSGGRVARSGRPPRPAPDHNKTALRRVATPTRRRHAPVGGHGRNGSPALGRRDHPPCRRHRRHGRAGARHEPTPRPTFQPTGGAAVSNSAHRIGRAAVRRRGWSAPRLHAGRWRATPAPRRRRPRLEGAGATRGAGARRRRDGRRRAPRRRARGASGGRQRTLCGRGGRAGGRRLAAVGRRPRFRRRSRRGGGHAPARRLGSGGSGGSGGAPPVGGGLVSHRRPFCHRRPMRGGCGARRCRPARVPRLGCRRRPRPPHRRRPLPRPRMIHSPPFAYTPRPHDTLGGGSPPCYSCRPRSTHRSSRRSPRRAPQGFLASRDNGGQPNR